MNDSTTATKARTPADILRAAKALIDSPEKWSGFNNKGRDEALCAIIAICEASVYGGDVQRLFLEAIGADSLTAAYAWNDAPGRTHAEVMAAFAAAIARATGGGE